MGTAPHGDDEEPEMTCMGLVNDGHDSPSGFEAWSACATWLDGAERADGGARPRRVARRVGAKCRGARRRGGLSNAGHVEVPQETVRSAPLAARNLAGGRSSRCPSHECDVHIIAAKCQSLQV